MAGDGISTAGVLFPALNFVLKTFRTGVELSIESTEDREILNTIDKASSDVLVAAGLLNKKGHTLNPEQRAKLEAAIVKTENALDRLRNTIERGKSQAPNRGGRKQDQKRLSTISQNETLKASDRLTAAHQELLEQIDFVKKSRGSARTSTDTEYLGRIDPYGKTASYIGTASPPPSYVQTSISPREEREQYLRQASARSAIPDRALPAPPRSPSNGRVHSPLTPPSGVVHSYFAPSELPVSQPFSLAQSRYPFNADQMTSTVDNIADYVQYNHDVMSSLTRPRQSTGPSASPAPAQRLYLSYEPTAPLPHQRVPDQRRVLPSHSTWMAPATQGTSSNTVGSLSRPFPTFSSVPPTRPDHSGHYVRQAHVPTRQWSPADMPAPLVVAPKTRTIVTDPVHGREHSTISSVVAEPAYKMANSGVVSPQISPSGPESGKPGSPDTVSPAKSARSRSF